MAAASGGAFRRAEGGLVDRARPLRFSFAGRAYTGLQGDTLASALLANGVHLVGRSFKYHRPRGILSAGVEEPSALVQLERGALTQPNLRATEIELYDGLVADTQNAWPNVRFDAGAVNSLLSKLFVAGFYYKTFMHPRSWWMRVYEPLIRRAAGLGRAPAAPDPDRYDKRHAHCDLLVVGGGPAGLMAALTAGRAGARVILADERSRLGGSLLGGSDQLDGRPGHAWAAAIAAELAAMPEVRILTRTGVAGAYDHGWYTAAQRLTDHLPPGTSAGARQRLWKIRAKRTVLATGALERPLTFADNDRPGVMLAEAAATYANRFGVRPGSRAVVFTNHDGAYQAALDLAAAGVEVAAIVDVRPAPPGCQPAQARAAGIRIVEGAAIVAVQGARRVRAVLVQQLTPDGQGVVGASETIACDLVAMSGGWNPTLHLASQTGARPRWDEARQCFLAGELPAGQRVAGAAAGAFDLAACLAAGAEAGAEAVAELGFAAVPTPILPVARGHETGSAMPLWLVPGARQVGHGAAKHFIDFQNDVTAADLLLALREGYEHIEHAKRYTTAGMATDQGKTSNVNALAIVAQAQGRPIAEVGTTTFRAPYTPVTFGALAGRDVGSLADPARVTPIQPWHVARGAVFEDVGQWKRPRYFPLAGEGLHEATNRECLAVRQGVGILDASTLGKIIVQGPDAATFLDRMYTGAWDKLGLGRARYAVLCKDDGMVMDDGIGARLGQDRFLFTTSTGNAARVLDWLEDWLQTEWPHFKVYLTSVTEQWAVAQVAGPRARDVLAAVTEGVDLDPATFPFMSVRDATVAGVPAKIFRVSFTGELSYEVYLPAMHALGAWEAIVAAGEPHGLAPFGTEAMHVLRAEKGYVIVGQETDGTVTPADVGLGWSIGKAKGDFVGKRSLARAGADAADRKQLVGLLTDDPATVLPEGAQLTAVADGVPPVPMLGHVTSSYWSATLRRSVALAMVKGGAARHGQRVYAPLVDGTVACTLAPPVFYDPEGKRAHG